MPRYLAIDYYGKALEERQNTLYRMLLAVPHHLECIDNYAHKGKKDDKTYNIPWQKESQDKLIRKTPQDELSVITSNLSNLERFNVAPSQDEFIPSSNPDSPPINFDIWSDLEVEVVNYLVESLQSNDVEDFVEDTLASQDQRLLEEQTSQDYLSEFSHKLPGVTTLCNKLKPKVVQDPFADDTGKALSESRIVYGADKDFSLSKEEEKLKRNHSFKETFILHQLGTPEVENDLDTTLEIPRSPENILKRQQTASKLPSKAQVDLQNCDTDDFKTTIKEDLADIGDDSHKHLLEKPQFIQNNKTMNDFVIMNLQGTFESDTNNSQSITDKKLESPIVTNREAPSTTPKNRPLCENLTPMTISPVTSASTQVISPSSKADITGKIWQNEKVFNDILVKILPVPNIKKNNNNTSNTTMPQKELHKEVIHGDLELQLPWDPLINTTSLATINNKLNKVELFPHKKRKETATLMEKEIFEKIPWKDIAVETVSESLSIDTTSTDLSLQSLQSGSASNMQWHGNPVDEIDIAAFKKSEPIKESAISTNQNTSNIESNKIQQMGEKCPDQTGFSGSNESSLKKRPWTPQSIEDTLPSLDDFLLLRSMKITGNGTPANSCAPAKNNIKAAKVRPSVSTPSTTNSQEEPASLKPPSKHITPVEISTEYQEVIEFLTSSIHPFLAQLKEKGVIKQDCDVINLAPDYTRFVVKQVQMMLQKRDDHDSQLTCQLAVCLHVLECVLELVVHCGINVALAHFSHSQDKYSAILGSALDSIRRHLFNAHVKFQQNSVLHPKVATVLEMLRQRMVREKGNKVLIVSYRHTDFLYRQLKDILLSFGGLQVSLFNSQEELSPYPINNCDVIVANSNSLTKDFPWNLFSHVIEYENKISDAVVSSNAQVEYIVLKMQYGVKEIPSTSIEDAVVQAKDEPVSLKQSSNLSQYIFIGSKNITSNDKLLLLLEGRHNIVIYERDYSFLYTSKDSKMNLQPHLMIDERTCVILEDLVNLDTQDKYEKLRDLVVSLSLKSTKCYIILCCKTENSGSSLTTNISNHLSMLFANIAYFKHNNSDFQMEILYCNTLEEMATSVKRIADQARQTSTVWEQDEWVKRKWLTVEMTRHERFLLSFPCMNSFSAQVMLTAAPLPRLLTMTLQELTSTCPWIPTNILNMFYQTTHLAPSVSAVHQEIPTRGATPMSEPTANQPPQHSKDSNTTTTMSSCNTPKSFVSDDSLWLAIQDDTNNTECLNNIDYGEDRPAETNQRYADNQSYFRSTPRNDGISGELYSTDQKSKHFGANSQPTNNYEIIGEQCKTMENSKYFDTNSQPVDSQVNTWQAGSSYEIEDFHTHSGTMLYPDKTAEQGDRRMRVDQCERSDRVTRLAEGEWNRPSHNNKRDSGYDLYQHADQVLKKTTEDWYRERKVRYQNPSTQSFSDPLDLSDKIERAFKKMPGEWYQNQESNTDYRNHHGNYGYSELQNTVPVVQYGNRTLKTGNDVSGYRLAEIDTSLDNQSTTSHKHSRPGYSDYSIARHPSQDVYQPTTVYSQQPLTYGNREQRDSLNSKMLPHNTIMKNADRSNIVTNVGVAQPRRRTQQIHGIKTDGRQQTVYKPRKERVVPGFEPSPDDYMNELSIFSKWNEGRIPAKKQKLTYERVPGAKDGQTKLIFSQ